MKGGLHLPSVGIGGLVGASLAAIVTAWVAEGPVVARSSGGPVVAAGRGETLEREPAAAPRSPERPGPAQGTSTEAPGSAVGREPRPAPPADGSPAARLARLEGEVKRLERSLARAEEIAVRHRTYDLPPSELKAMAAACELRWDHPAIRRDSPPKVPDAEAEELGLGAADREVVARLFAEKNDEALSTLSRLYEEVTGESAGTLSADAIFDEINDKTPLPVLRATYQRLALERAGLATPPASAEGQLPIERLYRLVTTMGDRLEASIAGELGPDVARELRDRHGGWGSKSRSSHGCP